MNDPNVVAFPTQQDPLAFWARLAHDIKTIQNLYPLKYHKEIFTILFSSAVQSVCHAPQVGPTEAPPNPEAKVEIIQ